MSAFKNIRLTFCGTLAAALLLGGCMATTSGKSGTVAGQKPVLHEWPEAAAGGSNGVDPLEAHMRARRMVDPKDTRRTHSYTRLVTSPGDNPPYPPKKPGDEPAPLQQAQSKFFSAVTGLIGEDKSSIKVAEAPAASPKPMKSSSPAILRLVNVEDLRLGRHPDKTRLVFDLSAEARIEREMSADGLTLRVFIPGAGWKAPDRQRYFEKDPLVRAYQVSVDQRGATIVFSMKRPARFLGWAYLPPNQMRGDRLYFDIKPR